ncbi:MAG: hypothetical protein K940chlam1_00241 [Candidatus Anoxychlamydiales bacterium]|nr:hypothetical protein [Candidatus Anoxychlamydiales bacterium]NGX35689.1 hypothetical protein [Candidatus Anoxychlamydiales bacterium]
METITKVLSSYNMKTNGVMGSLFIDGYKIPRFSEIKWAVIWDESSNPSLAYKYEVTIGKEDNIVRKIKFTAFVNFTTNKSAVTLRAGSDRFATL